MLFDINEKLTKDYILKFISQEDIFEYYLHIPVQTKHLIHSPLRSNDDTPSFGFRYFGDKLRAKDFNGWFSGDCWDLVGFLHGYKSYIAKDFMKILEQIAKDFRLHDYRDKQQIKTLIKNQRTLPPVKIDYQIEVIYRDWIKEDLDFWLQYGITLQHLIFRNVRPCLYVYGNGELKYDFNLNFNKPAYKYDFGVYQNKNEIQIYYPKMPKNKKFISLSTCMFGIFKLSKAKILIITKSYKDLMAIEAHAKPLYSIEVVSLRAESIIPSEKEIAYLKGIYDYIFTLFDYDRAGINAAWKCKKKYNLPYLFLTDGKKLSKVNYGAKDFSDYRKFKGEAEAIKLVQTTINWFETIWIKKN